MESNSLPQIRPMVPGDFYMVEPFFAQMSSYTHRMFNGNNCNYHSLLACFDPENYGKYSFGVRRNFIAAVPTEDGRERIAGLVFLWDLNSKAPSLGICVAEDWKGKHLGRKLINYAIEYCANHDKGAIFLSTNTENIAGQGLYRSSGFKQLGINKNGEIMFFYPFPDTPPADDGTV